jgi:hypothetical protein
VIVRSTDEPSAAELLRSVLELVETGELEANSAHAVALVRRIEGAIVALEARST